MTCFGQVGTQVCVAGNQHAARNSRAQGADEALEDPVHPRHAVQIALWRYNSAMATIQVREVPEELYEVLRRRARRAGQSMQSYMREQLLALAGRPTKEEAIEEIETVLEHARTSEPVAASVVADLAAERR